MDDKASLILNDKNGIPERVTKSHVEEDVICNPAIVPVHDPAVIPKSGLNPIKIFPSLEIALYSFILSVYCEFTAI